MERTSWVTLLLIIVVAAVVGVLAGTQFFGVVPPLSYFTAFTFAGIAAVCGGYGWKVKQAIAHGKVGMDRSQLHPITIARVLALAKASAIVAAVGVGAVGGYTIVLAVRRSEIAAAGQDLPAGIAITIAAVVLLVVSLVVEMWCEVPPGDDSTEMLGETA